MSYKSVTKNLHEVMSVIDVSANGIFAYGDMPLLYRVDYGQADESLLGGLF
jgi:hypothetical protein